MLTSPRSRLANNVALWGVCTLDMTSASLKKKKRKADSKQHEPIKLLRKDPEVSKFGGKLLLFGGFVVCALGFVLANHLLNSATGRSISLKPATLNLPRAESMSELQVLPEDKFEPDLMESLQQAQNAPAPEIPESPQPGI